MTSDTTRSHRQEADDAPGSPLWTGILGFAYIMLLMLGGVHVGAIASLFDVDASELLLFRSYAGWGVAHMAIGTAAFLTGIALFYRRPWSRIATIVIASVSAVTNLAFLSAAPVWYGLQILIDILVIYAVTVHFEDERD